MSTSAPERTNAGEGTHAPLAQLRALTMVLTRACMLTHLSKYDDNRRKFASQRKGNWMDSQSRKTREAPQRSRSRARQLVVVEKPASRKGRRRGIRPAQGGPRIAWPCSSSINGPRGSCCGAFPPPNCAFARLIKGAHAPSVMHSCWKGHVCPRPTLCTRSRASSKRLRAYALTRIHAFRRSTLERRYSNAKKQGIKMNSQRCKTREAP